ncbi:MAG: hypothetical protein ACXVDA_23260 [Ktedonobacterales bacterium]
MATDSRESIRDIPDDDVVGRAVDTKPEILRPPNNSCLAETLRCIREATQALLPQYRIIEQHRPLPKDAIDGILWGVSLLVERLDTSLEELCAAVVTGDMTAEQAVQRAHELVLQAVTELRFGARFRERRFFVPAALPPIAELGRLYAITQKLCTDLGELSDRCEGWTSSLAPRATVYMHIRSLE